MSMRVRLTPVLLMVMLVVVAGCSMQTAKAAVQKDVTLNSIQYNGATANLGQMYLNGQGPYNLPYSTRVSPGVHKIRFIPPSGFYVVALSLDDQIVWNHTGEPCETSVPIGGDPGDPTITAIYQKNGLPAYVGGVVLPTNTYAIFAPYLAVICLVVTTAVAIKRCIN